MEEKKFSSNPADHVDMIAEEAMALIEPKKEEPKIGSKEWFDKQILTKAFRKYWGIKLTPIKRDKRKVRRNELCECGSGIKYKKCCGK